VINRERQLQWSQDAKTKARNVWRDRNIALAREQNLGLQPQPVPPAKWFQDAKARARNIWRDRNIALARERDLSLQRQRVPPESLKERVPGVTPFTAGTSSPQS